MTQFGAFVASHEGRNLKWIWIDGSSAVWQGGRQIGVYVDNETPNQDAIIAAHVGEGRMVIAGEYNDEHKRHPGAITAYEWYPFSHGKAWLPVRPPKAEAYILQRDFRWPGDPIGATKRQRLKLLVLTLLNRPKMILFYDAHPTS